MKTTNTAIKKELEKRGFAIDYKNILAVKDELEDYEKADYEYKEDALYEAVLELESIGRLGK